MNKELLIQQAKDGYGDDVAAFISDSIDGFVLVPIEPNFPRFHLRTEVVIDHAWPPENTAEAAQRDMSQRHLDSLVTRLHPQFKELIYKAMIQASGES
tara:strand:+ start:317 stop:610 length:294 start_codon:yes stop_codon:yes gene_type:complete